MNETTSIIPISKCLDRLDEIIEIIEKAFNYDKKNSFKIDFYSLFNLENFENCYALFYKNILVGHIGVKLRNLKFKNDLLKCALIGGVAIKKEFQGKGIFKDALGQVIDIYKNNTGLMFLWGNHTKLYEQFHFYECGNMFQIGENNFTDNIAPNDYLKADGKKLSSHEIEQLKNLYLTNYQNQFLTFDRTDEDWQDIFNANSIELWIKKENGRIQSYFMANRGQDLDGIVHEYTDIKSINKNNTKVWAPSQETEGYNLKVTPLYLAFIKISNFNLFFNYINKISNNIITDCSYIKKDSSISFKINKTIYKKNIKEFLDLLFGPDQPIEMKKIIPTLFISGPDGV